MRDRDHAYAEAILTVAQAEDALDATEDELLQVARAVAGNRELHRTLTDPRIPAARRLGILDEVLPAAHPATRSALALLITSGRIRQLDDIAHAVAERAAEARRRALAEVWVAVPLSPEHRRRLREALEQATGKQLEMKVFVDPQVVGGVRAKIGDTVIDDSVARRLEDISARFGV